MNELIESWDSSVDGELNERNMRRKLQDRGYTVNRYVYPPGSYFPPHTHDVDKIDGVVAGRFRMSMHGQSFDLVAGDCLAVPRGAVHSAEVIGDEAVVSLDAIRI